jgi:hypothetical protein
MMDHHQKYFARRKPDLTYRMLYPPAVRLIRSRVAVLQVNLAANRRHQPRPGRVFGHLSGFCTMPGSVHICAARRSGGGVESQCDSRKSSIFDCDWRRRSGRSVACRLSRGLRPVQFLDRDAAVRIPDRRSAPSRRPRMVPGSAASKPRRPDRRTVDRSPPI